MSDLRQKIKYLKDILAELPIKETISIMEVCGTHTMSIAEHGIRAMLPSGIELISGPGCPVCVTPATQIEQAIELAKRDDVIVATFGDMFKVPSRGDSLQNHPGVKIIYNPLDSLKLALENSDKEIVLLGVGFETTVPLMATVITQAAAKGISNFSLLSMHKTVPDALVAILKQEHSLTGLLLPGHVSAITGASYYDFLKEFNAPSVIAGFEPIEILEAIYLIADAAIKDKPMLANNYRSVVSKEGNQTAQRIVRDVFTPCNSEWRGIGEIPNSGLALNTKYEKFDAAKKHKLQNINVEDPKGCLCGNILLGKAKPFDCGHFAKGCSPANPIGPCMVSNEGTCAAYYKYDRN